MRFYKRRGQPKLDPSSYPDWLKAEIAAAQGGGEGGGAASGAVTAERAERAERDTDDRRRQANTFLLSSCRPLQKISHDRRVAP